MVKAPKTLNPNKFVFNKKQRGFLKNYFEDFFGSWIGIPLWIYRRWRRRRRVRIRVPGWVPPPFFRLIFLAEEVSLSHTKWFFGSTVGSGSFKKPMGWAYYYYLLLSLSLSLKQVTKFPIHSIYKNKSNPYRSVGIEFSRRVTLICFMSYNF